MSHQKSATLDEPINAEVVSRKGAAIKIERIELTEAQKRRLSVGRKSNLFARLIRPKANTKK